MQGSGFEFCKSWGNSIGSRPFPDPSLVFGIEGWVLGVWGLRFRVWGTGFWVWGMGFGVKG